ncbi:hypothetical protein J6590_028374 [Homalodisca vitripennis]|nr:hypothetical protein J6590_028374 [Homalodisca vitripennis]
MEIIMMAGWMRILSITFMVDGTMTTLKVHSKCSRLHHRILSAYRVVPLEAVIVLAKIHLLAQEKMDSFQGKKTVQNSIKGFLGLAAGVVGRMKRSLDQMAYSGYPVVTKKKTCEVNSTCHAVLLKRRGLYLIHSLLVRSEKKRELAETPKSPLLEMRMSSFVPFIPHQPLVLREDLLYKSVSYKWKLGMKAGVTSSDIINDILHEDVGSKLPVQLTSQQLSSLKLSLDKLLAKKFAVKKRLTELVMKTTVDHKSGMAVSAMIFAPLKILIPSDLVGGSKNKIKLLHVIQRTLKFGRMDIIPLKFLMEGLTVKGWLKTVRETKIREHVLAKVVKWIWIVTKRLVASLFYVTEGQGCHHKLLYFPKKSWQSRTDSAFNYLVTSGTLQPLDKVEAERLAALRKPASLRWLPKKIGLRPVVSVK